MHILCRDHIYILCIGNKMFLHLFLFYCICHILRNHIHRYLSVDVLECDLFCIYLLLWIVMGLHGFICFWLSWLGFLNSCVTFIHLRSIFHFSNHHKLNITSCKSFYVLLKNRLEPILHNHKCNQNYYICIIASV